MGERGQTGERSPAGDPSGDPEEHPEQHAARQTGEQSRGETQEEGTDNELLDSEEHSEAGGSFGTSDEG